MFSMNLVGYVYALFYVISSVQCQILKAGNCPNITLLPDLDPDQVSGQWFQLEKFYLDAEVSAKCATVEFRPSLEGNRIDAFHVSLDDKTNLIQIAKGSAPVQDNSVGEFVVDYLLHGGNLGNEKLRYQILDTDYSTFAVLWSCIPICDNYHIEMMWILGRSSSMLPRLRTSLYSRLESLGLETRSLIAVSHKYCTFSPMKHVSMFRPMAGNSLSHILVKRHVSGGSVAEPPIKEIKYEDLRNLLNAGKAILVDVREPKELETDGKIPGSYNIPLGDVEKAFQLPSDKFLSEYKFPLPNKHDPNLIFSCKSGKRATVAVQTVQRLGFTDARCYCGSFLDWVEKGGKVEKPST